MSKFANRLTRGLEPYVPGEQPKEEGLIKLNTNENPYPPGPSVKKALENFDCQSLRLYPDPEAAELRGKLASSVGLRTENVFVGNGSDEVLALIFQSFFEPSGAPLLFPEITYSFYEVYAKRYGIPYELIPLDAEGKIRIEDYARESQAVILANPNAPTGRALTPPEIAKLCRMQPDRLVVADEAYVDFAGEGMSAVALLDGLDNLLVVQTFSKSRSLAGLRVGMAFASEEIIEDLNTQKNCFNSYPLDRLAQTLASAALDDEGYYRHINAKVRACREKTAAALEKLGFCLSPSESNFLWIRHPDFDGGMLYRELRSRRILVRRWSGDKLGDYLRVTVGTDEEMAVFIRAISEILEYNVRERGAK